MLGCFLRPLRFGLHTRRPVAHAAMIAALGVGLKVTQRAFGPSLVRLRGLRCPTASSQSRARRQRQREYADEQEDTRNPTGCRHESNLLICTS